MEDHLAEPNLEYVKSEEFNQECAVQLRKVLEHTSVSDNSVDSGYKDSIWSNSNNSTSSSVLSVGPSPHKVPRVKGYLYYAGLGLNGHGPKLIHRISVTDWCPLDPRTPATAVPCDMM